MLFGLSPLFALLPLVLYIILAFRDVHPVFNVGLCVVISALLTGQDLMDMGKVIGRHGQTAGALRTLLTAAAAKQGKRFVLEILDDEKEKTFSK